jgi:predicted nucleotide-binding protein (sugar kinase/HSP70/actin superfamily)
MKIGIPRALFFYRYYPLFKTFFEKLGIEVVTSPLTTREILKDGAKITSDEICLPVKVFNGHIKYLASKADYLLVPRMISIEKSLNPRYTCPKFIGLPSLVKSIFDPISQILEVEINVRKKDWARTFLELGKRFTKNKKTIVKAFQEASLSQTIYENALLNGKSYEEAITIKDKTKVSLEEDNKSPLSVALIGHPYILFDTYINLDIQKKLKNLGVKVLTQFNIEPEQIENEIKKYKEISWSFEREMVGATSYYLQRKEIKGILLLISFPCGPGSVINEIIQREVMKEKRMSILTLILDEHTADAGLMTRIESFIDLIKRK